ncbi:MAG: hypothetical protein KA914_14735 [Ottowia sp.]|nr:hypothetical protein [Ottowia sp.]
MSPTIWASSPPRTPIGLHALRRATASVLCASAMLMAAVSGPAQAQSEVSVGLSMLPVASVVGGASVAGAAAGAVVAVPAALLVSGAVLTVKAVEVSARGTVYLLERASDGAAASVAIAGAAAGGVALSVGATVVTTVIASGVILSAAGEAIAYIPNAIGKALLYDERLG